jgi:acyl carrier protein
VTTAGELLGFLQRVMQKEFEVPAEKVRPEALLAKDLGLDSLDAVVMAMRLEDETGLELSEDELKSLDTVDSVVALVSRRLAERSDLAS